MAINPVHTELAQVATELISENGVTMQLKREVTAGPDYDPVITVETVDVIAVRSKYSTMEVGDGSRIKANDIKLLVDSSVDPREYDKIIDGANEYQRIDVDTIAPGELNIMYKIQARL